MSETETRRRRLDSETREEFRTLLDEAVVLQLRKLNDDKKEKEEGSSWMALLKSPVVVTLITIVLGGFWGTWLADRLQRNNARLMAEQKAVDEALTAVGRITTASQAMIGLADQTWNAAAPGLSDEQRKLIKDRSRQIEDNYNLAMGDWEIQRERLGYMLAVNYRNPEQVRLQWKAVTDGVKEFSDCASTYEQQTETKKQRVQDVAQACSVPRGHLQSALLRLTQMVAEGKAQNDSTP